MTETINENKFKHRPWLLVEEAKQLVPCEAEGRGGQ